MFYNWRVYEHLKNIDMNEFIWHFKCMIYARKHKQTNEYSWYKYLVIFQINSFIKRINFINRLLSKKDEMPF